MSFLLSLYILSSTAFAQTSVHNYELTGQVRFVSLSTRENGTPQTIGTPIAIRADFQISSNEMTIIKVFETSAVNAELKTKFQIWYHRDQASAYFSQQVYFYEADKLTAFCSEYFSLTQKSLVPGSCWGRSLVTPETLKGVSIFVHQ